MFDVSPAQYLMWGMLRATFNSKILTLIVLETTWASHKLALSHAYAKTQRVANKTDFIENKISVDDICDLVK